MYEDEIPIGRVVPIRQSETPELRKRVDIMDPMLLNFGAWSDWLNFKMFRDYSQSHVFPASASAADIKKNREPQKTGRIRISLLGRGYKYNIYPHHPVASMINGPN